MLSILQVIIVLIPVTVFIYVAYMIIKMASGHDDLLEPEVDLFGSEVVFIYKEGMTIVKDERGCYGFQDLSGKIVIPCQWKFADNFSEGLARVKDDNEKWLTIDKSGNIV
ncbi:MAG: WG repeat-containing protein [Bacteroidaceae bacterium]|nr:WG repeat-containing protein [Bacteroidaceae bacterium]